MGLFGLTLDVSAEFASRFLTVTEENNLDAESKFTAALNKAAALRDSLLPSKAEFALAA